MADVHRPDTGDLVNIGSGSPSWRSNGRFGGISASSVSSREPPESPLRFEVLLITLSPTNPEMGTNPECARARHKVHRGGTSRSRRSHRPSC
jgi:hypothetical protein